MRFTSVDTLVEVVGIVADVKHMSLEEAAPPMFYVPRAQAIVPWQTRRMSIVMRTDAEVAALAPAARAEVGALDAQLPLANLRTMEQVIAASAAPPRFRTLLIGAFAALALLLASLGVYGVVSYSVSQRTREMAIRMALGARAPAVLRLVVRQGMTPVAVGLILGLLAALALSRLLSAVLFEVATLDATVFLTVPALMLAIAAFASAGPAHRATRVDPLQALREE
jgi:putative ABC transport system permease protein